MPSGGLGEQRLHRHRPPNGLWRGLRAEEEPSADEFHASFRQEHELLLPPSDTGRSQAPSGEARPGAAPAAPLTGRAGGPRCRGSPHRAGAGDGPRASGRGGHTALPSCRQLLGPALDTRREGGGGKSPAFPLRGSGCERGTPG